MDVFKELLQTNMGHYLVQLYEGDFDFHATFKKLSYYPKISIKASIGTPEVLTYIISENIHTSECISTNNDLIFHWCDKIRVYEALV